MSGLMPKPPKPPKPVIDVTETPDVAVAIDSNGLDSARRRVAASRKRTARGQLQIPKSGAGVSSGVSIPK